MDHCASYLFSHGFGLFTYWTTTYPPTKSTLYKQDQQITFLMCLCNVFFFLEGEGGGGGGGWGGVRKHILWLLIWFTSTSRCNSNRYPHIRVVLGGTSPKCHPILLISLLKKLTKKYTGYNLKTVELLDCVLIGICAVIRSNTVCTDWVWSLFSDVYRQEIFLMAIFSDLGW